MHLLLPLMLFLCAVTCGCSTDNIRRGIYEGFRQRPLTSGPVEPAPFQRSPDFDEYERMRKERVRSSVDGVPN